MPIRERTISENEENCKKDAARIDADKQARLKEQEKRAGAENNLKLAVSYLKEHGQDEWLISGLAGVEEQLNGLRSKQEEMVRKQDEQATAVDDSGTGDENHLITAGSYAEPGKRELEDASKKLSARQQMH